MNASDQIRLRHMLEMAYIAQAITLNRTRASLDEDVTLQLALTRAIEVIGEAASKVSDECQQATSQLPWSAIIGMRNRLIHAYLDINLDILWRTVINDIPTLIAEPEKILPPDEGKSQNSSLKSLKPLPEVVERDKLSRVRPPKRGCAE